MTVSHWMCFVLLGSSLVAASGCRSFNAERERRKQTDSFTENLALASIELTAPLSLEQCLQIAMVRNYDVRKADLDRKLYRIGKNVAFTAFLPTVSASAGYQSYSKEPQQTEKRFGSGDLTSAMPIFMPSTWFLYAASRHGYAAAGVAAHYVRQGIVVQTTAAYFDVLVQQDTVAALESQWAAAKETAERVAGLAEEGLVAQWEGAQARLAADLREVELNQARRRLTILRAELLRTMGLSPQFALQLSGEVDAKMLPEGTTAELVLKALEIHPELALADRQVVIQNHQVRQAFCDFLPTISLFSTGTWTGNELAMQAENWITGFNGTWTLFNGLAIGARYTAAKFAREQTTLARESTFLSVIVGVTAAEAAVKSAAEGARVREQAYQVAAAKWADYDAQAREGLRPLADALDARAVMDLAQVTFVQHFYQEQVAIANLELAMGLTLVPETLFEPSEEEYEEEEDEEDDEDEDAVEEEE